jgi:hypothetical protein
VAELMGWIDDDQPKQGKWVDDTPEKGFLEKTFVDPVRWMKQGMDIAAQDYFYKPLANIAGLADMGAQKIQELTGMKSEGAFKVVEHQLRKVGDSLMPTKEEIAEDGLAPKLYRALGATPTAIGTYALASQVVGPVAGMALVDMAKEADKGIKDVLVAGVKGAAMGGILHAVQPLERLTRSLTLAGIGAGESAIQGQDVTDIAVSLLTMGGLGVMGGKGEMTLRDVLGQAVRKEKVTPKAGPITEEPKVETPITEEVKETVTKTPYDYGKEAYERGVKNAPALDQGFLKSLEGKEPGSSVKAMEEWQQGWIDAPIKEPPSTLPVDESLKGVVGKQPWEDILYRGEVKPGTKVIDRIPAQYAEGEHWTPHKDVAKSYGENVREEKIGLNNPYIFKLENKVPYYEELLKEFGTDNPKEITKLLQAKGYDGLVVEDVPIGRKGVDRNRTTEIIKFNPGVGKTIEEVPKVEPRPGLEKVTLKNNPDYPIYNAIMEHPEGRKIINAIKRGDDLAYDPRLAKITQDYNEKSAIRDLEQGKRIETTSEFTTDMLQESVRQELSHFKENPYTRESLEQRAVWQEYNYKTIKETFESDPEFLKEETTDTIIQKLDENIIGIKEDLYEQGYTREQINSIVEEIEKSGTVENAIKATEGITEEVKKATTELFDTSKLFTLSGDQPILKKEFEKAELKGDRLFDVKKATTDELLDRKRGIQLESALIPGLRQFVEQDISPKTKSFLTGIRETGERLLHFLAPRVGVKTETLDTIMTMMGQRNKAEYKLDLATRDMEKTMSKLSNAENIVFIDNVKRGTLQPDETLQKIADYLRKADDELFATLQEVKPDMAWMENHFRVLWKTIPGTMQEKLIGNFRGPLQGGKGYMKQHTLEDMSSGIEMGGVPYSYNPITMFKMHYADVMKYITARRMWDALKYQKDRVFVKLGYQVPEGYTRIDDNIARVFFSKVPMEEAYDEVQFKSLLNFAEKIGVDHERLAKLRRGAWGLSYDSPLSQIKTKFAGPEQVIAHELGHQLDDKYGLINHFGLRTPQSNMIVDKMIGKAERENNISRSMALKEQQQINNELRDLADMRYHGKDTSEYFHKYVRKAEEKMAVILESFIHAPDMLKEVAPTIYKKFSDFLYTHPELTELMDIKPSVVLGTNAMQKDVGLSQSGEWYVNNGAARLLNRYLGRDYVREAAIGRGLLWIKNSTTAMELSLSAFHFVFETLETTASGIGLGMGKIIGRGVAQGDYKAILEGLKDIATAPLTAYTTAREGGSAIKYMKDPAEFIKTHRGEKFVEKYPETAQMLDDLFTGGGKLAMHQDYKINSLRTFNESLKENNYIGAALRGIPALNEMLMKPMFETYIPRLKIGLFFKEYSNALVERTGEIERGDLTKPELARRTWDFVEDRLGEMNFDNLFWDRTFKSSMQVLIRSVTWKLGNIRGFGKAFVEQGIEFKNAYQEGRIPKLAPEMAWAWGVVATHVALATAIQYMATGQQPTELKDIVYPQINKDGDRISVPTYLRDAFHLYHKPVGWAASSTSGWIGRFSEILKNKDFYGTQVYDPEEAYTSNAIDALIHMIPIPFGIQSAKKMKEKGEGPIEQTMGMLGFTKAPYYMEQSPARQLANDLIGEQTSNKAQTKEEFERRSLIKDLSIQYIRGLKHRSDTEQNNVTRMLAENVMSGKLTMIDIDRFVKKVGSEPLAQTMQNLNLKDSLKVWDKADEAERKTLAPVIMNKIFSLMDHKPEEFKTLEPKIAKWQQEVSKIQIESTIGGIK